MDPSKHRLISYFAEVAIIVSNLTFFLGHWIFAWKYWPVAGNLANLKSGTEKSKFCSYCLLYGMSFLIVVDCVVYGLLDGESYTKKDAHKVEMRIASLTMEVFLFADFIIVLVALLRIKKALQKFPHIQINKCMVRLHGVMLMSMCLSGVL